MGAEYELKYRANRQTLAAVRQKYSGSWQTLSMETTYYDTPSGSLSQRRYMLRRRLENGISVCTLKTPGKGNTRGEWETECEAVEAAIDMLCKLGCPAVLPELCKEGLIPICGARFTRQALTLQLPGCTAELALDSGILFSGSRELPLAEIELELKAGSTEALDAFATEFAAEFSLTAEEKSKFARALSLYKEV